MNVHPAYYRARLTVLYKLIAEANEDSISLLRNGVLPTHYSNSDFEAQIKNAMPDESDSELTFTELCSLNTWFAIHPEKIAGIEIITTSRSFPVKIKGTKQEIIDTIESGMIKVDIEKIRKIKILKLKAKAKIKLLQLIKL
jgi:hypothetical protein